jgi:hypothetical protein
VTQQRRWRDAEPVQFAATILAAAEQLGVQPLAVEKDYWACEALRAITLSHPSQVVFKGGTSLEKLRLIRRFSEDLDLLVVEEYASKRAAERSLKEMIESAAKATGGTSTKRNSGGGPGTFHRSAYLSPPLAHSAQPGAIAEASAILIELGQSGGPHPHDCRPVRSLLSRQLAGAGFETSVWDDLTEFEVSILHPGRTLLEKLLRINNFATDQESQPGDHGWPRIGRQFYDIWALLGADEVLALLMDKSLVQEILTSCFDVSEAFTPDQPVPLGGFARSLAFAADNPLAIRLGEEHDVAMRDLYYGTDAPPTFDDVLERVYSHRDDLDPG